MAGKTKTCHRCNASFEVEFEPGNPFSEMGMRFARFCSDCSPIIAEEARIEEESLMVAEKAARWAKICPAIYRTTDLSHPDLEPAFVEEANRWRAASKKGLGFVGASGKGKTRLLYHALARAFTAGLWTHATSHTIFRRIAIEANSGDGENRVTARNRLEMMGKVDVLLIDDLGKPSSTETVDAELEELIEFRTARARPILWSANGSGMWLLGRFGDDRGEPIVRRLTEFTTIVSA